VAVPTAPPTRDATQVARLLSTPEMRTLIARLEETRWTGRPGYPIRTMLGMALVKSLYVLPTWTRVVSLVAEYAALRKALGVNADAMSSQWACYRFATKLREFRGALAECIDSVLAGLRDENPNMGQTVAIDGSDLPAYANGLPLRVYRIERVRLYVDLTVLARLATALAEARAAAVPLAA
jgi:hypothetical protein